MARLCTFTVSIEVDDDFTEENAQVLCDKIEHSLAVEFYIDDAQFELEE